MPLSPDEREILAAIERDLAETDPELVEALDAEPEAGRQPRWLPVRPREVATLTAALGALVALHTVAPELHTAVTAAITSLVTIGWLVHAARPGRPTSQPIEGRSTQRRPSR